jgi:molybdenum cofactor cytidylyltransferase
VATVVAIMLAAGESTRMGRQKALLPWEGTTLIAYQLAQLTSVDEISEIIVVTGHEPAPIREIAARSARTRTVHNDAYRSGKVSSIKAGLAAIPKNTDAILVLAVDQPRPAHVLRSVIDAHVREQGVITAPACDGRRGHPVVFDRRMLPELMAITEDTQGLRDVMRRHEGAVIELELDDPIVHLDLNTPADIGDRSR